ncbi:hypothetical protein ACWEQN_47045 [Streptomyces sp. NPDC004129]
MSGGGPSGAIGSYVVRDDEDERYYTFDYRQIVSEGFRTIRTSERVRFVRPDAGQTRPRQHPGHRAGPGLRDQPGHHRGEGLEARRGEHTQRLQHGQPGRRYRRTRKHRRIPSPAWSPHR